MVRRVTVMLIVPLVGIMTCRDCLLIVARFAGCDTERNTAKAARREAEREQNDNKAMNPQAHVPVA
jgi:hypothetical protein